MPDFNNKDQAMSPKKAFICSMLYASGADGELDQQEIGKLLALIGSSFNDGIVQMEEAEREFLKDAFAFVKQHSTHDFLEMIRTKNILNQKQKLHILTNMLDSVLSDGKLMSNEQEMVIEFQHKLGVSNEDFKPLYEVILFKNTRNLF